MAGRLTGIRDRIGSTSPSPQALGVAKRATLLVARAGPYHANLGAGFNRPPPSGRAARRVRSGIYLALTAGPQLVLDQVAQATLGGPPTTPDQVARHRRALLAGDAALVGIGLLGQAAVNHSGRTGPVADVGRSVSGQIAVGAAAAAIVIGWDVVIGPVVSRPDMQPPAARALTIVSRSAQRRLLRRAASVLLLPTRPEAFHFVGGPEPAN